MSQNKRFQRWMKHSHITMLGLDLCDEVGPREIDAFIKSLPSLFLEIGDGAEMRIGRRNVFAQVEDQIWCFASGKSQNKLSSTM
ncbi:hypothetical protein AMTR_s00060p00145000 [Amborella trichopoda]|uniref:Uncharacterized protein n=1 Tax=Amborella trichopoda TaxID=13333 RepID=W1NKW9_AMBTC|nr:hypothetical protein AMTR_s00060p00145000 [Amborella trichopoda]